MSKSVVVNEEEFETLAEAIQDEDGWTVDESTITDPDGDVAVQLTDTSEKGQGLAEWLILTAFVALFVVVGFAFFAPASSKPSIRRLSLISLNKRKPLAKKYRHIGDQNEHPALPRKKERELRLASQLSGNENARSRTFVLCFILL